MLGFACGLDVGSRTDGPCFDRPALLNRLLAVFLAPGRDEVFRIDVQRIGDSVDVVEVGDGLNGIVDCDVVQAVPPQFVQMAGLHAVWRLRQC